MKHLLCTIITCFSFYSLIYSQQTQIFNNPANNGMPANTFTVPAGVTSMTVEAWGGGGGGGTAGSPAQRGKGGGGGGAYASSILTVIPGTQYTVVVGTGGSAGANGIASSFGGTLVVAAGGSAAPGENGGAGGTVAASTGTIEFAGGAGGNSTAGNNHGGGGGGGSATATMNGGNGASNINENGGAGGSGQGMGGAGGNNLGSGGAGTAPGGGGGGKGDGGTASGAGAPGQVTLTWTCPTYSLTNTTVNTAICNGSTANVTLTSSPEALPVGTYLVRYNLSAPNAATGISTNMTVASAGMGIFTIPAVNLTNNGATTVSITNLISGSGTPNCTSAISGSNSAIVTVGALASSITPTQIICPGTSPTILTGSLTPATNSRYNITAAVLSGSVTGFTHFQTSIPAGTDIEPLTLSGEGIVRYTLTPYAFGTNALDNGGTGDDCIGTSLLVDITVTAIAPTPLLSQLKAMKAVPIATFSTGAVASYYQFEYKPSDSEDWISLGTATTGGVVIEGVDDETNYDFRVRVSCDNVTYSDWATLLNAILPIELLYFTATQVSNTIVTKWATASEQDNAYMEVQRSKDGIQFVPLHPEKGNGTTSELHYYSWTDYTPMPGLNYYRLKQVDFDSNFQYHNIVVVDFQGKPADAGIRLFPTQVTDQLTLVLDAPTTQETTLQVIDMFGRVLQSQRLGIGTLQEELPVSALPQGQYLVSLQTDAGVKTARFVKVN